MSADNCPVCHKRISDTDSEGCELESGQRYCLVHLTEEQADAEGPEFSVIWREVVLPTIVAPCRCRIKSDDGSHNDYQCPKF